MTLPEQIKLKKSISILKALAHPVRFSILKYIDKHKTTPVNKIYKTLKYEQALTSQHLKILRVNGIVKSKKEGKFIHYSIDYEKVNQLNMLVNNFMENGKKS